MNNYQPTPMQAVAEATARAASAWPGPLGSRRRAERDCQYLNTLGVQVGKHVCHFKVVEDKPGFFSVKCKSHPTAPIQESTLAASSRQD